tara:strand:+ start:27469 stop:28209 length:741 start_codon:yes stop_codon:yes gene_type:complete
MTFDPAQLDHWVFDLDNTLYPADCNLFTQVDRRMGEFIAERLNLPYDQARQRQKAYFRTYGTTLRGLMSEHDIPPREFLDYVHDIDFSVLTENVPLKEVLSRLPGTKVIYTNADVGYAEKVLDRLGLSRAFSGVFDIHQADYRPKPAPESYQKMIRLFGITPERAVMIEDIARNLVPAHHLGMKTVWVPTALSWSRDGMEEKHIDHTAEDLTGWLQSLLDRSSGETVPEAEEPAAGKNARRRQGAY